MRSRAAHERKLRLGSLFSGIGGLDLGMHRGLGGGECVELAYQCEHDFFRLAILAKRFPHVRARFRDVRMLRSDQLPYVDVLVFGFPCKNVSSAGKREGIVDGRQSKLWFEGERIIRYTRPPVVVVENVASGGKLWLPQVRGDLHVLGYDSHALAVSAFDVGAPHMRRRVFVVAWRKSLVAVASDSDGGEEHVEPGRRSGQGGQEAARARRSRDDGASPGADEERQLCEEEARDRTLWRWSRDRARSVWIPRPPVAGVCGVDDGAPSRLDRLAALGDAVVVQCAEAVGKYVRHEVLPKLRLQGVVGERAA